ncbi:hypothetical protein AVEN_95670-1 [Araneus ventricosus]|uniref:RNase H type-1 domain-containing protein n=1 Tax=Araneus ventricosus TaxID=182803 RepID=A0A4Y2J6G1_ARAVE|nr:hypothetical protein AVEN_95670-1 [Araneus ventricosus]
MKYSGITIDYKLKFAAHLSDIKGLIARHQRLALQVIEGLLPLLIKVKAESTLVRVSRLKRYSNFEGLNYTFKDFEQPSPPILTYPALFNIGNNTSFNGYIPSNGQEIFSDGSKLKNKTGCAFCGFDRGSLQKEWMAKLEYHNTAFQVESLALKEEIAWANGQKCRAKLWCDSESVLKTIISPKSRNSIIKEIQMSLHTNPKIVFGWVKPHIGIPGNEAADELAKKEGPKSEIAAPKSYVKKPLKTASLQTWQTDWDEGETLRLIHNSIPKVSDILSSWTREVIQFATGHGPFPCFLKRFNLYHTIVAPVGKCATLCTLLLSTR